ncbi:MAG: arylsulfatase [Planctomycetaceae bacterium]|nr:arylsulfatase [Planctomycetaceae bacterium]
MRIPLVLLALMTLGLPATLDGADKPNIVIILADDLGWADVSFHGEQIKTPHIDSLVADGSELNRFYVCPVCSPTRAGLMTGRYPIRFGLMRAVVPPWRKGGLDPAETTLPEALAKAGYENRGAFGKWHLGHSHLKYHPLRRGFTEFVGHYNGAIDYFTHEREGELDWHRDYDTNRDKGYSTDLIGDAAAEFIKRHAADDSPFLCYVPFNAPHSPFQAKPEDLKKYEHLPAKTTPEQIRKKKKKKKTPARRARVQRQTLAAMISSMDEGVGKILAAIDDADIRKNTLVWFFSDNGGTGPGDNRPLNGQKATCYEGGIRVTAAVRWPGTIPAGGKVTAPLAYIDVLPTLLTIAGLNAHGGKPLDGVDATELLTGKRDTHARDVYSYIGQQGEDTEQITLIEPRWKLLVIGRKVSDAADDAKRTIQLFDIIDDPNEQTNLADANPEVVARMLGKLTKFRDLQPATAVPPYRQRDADFKPPPNWKIGD